MTTCGPAANLQSFVEAIPIDESAGPQNFMLWIEGICKQGLERANSMFTRFIERISQNKPIGWPWGVSWTGKAGCEGVQSLGKSTRGESEP